MRCASIFRLTSYHDFVITKKGNTGEKEVVTSIRRCLQDKKANNESWCVRKEIMFADFEQIRVIWNLRLELKFNGIFFVIFHKFLFSFFKKYLNFLCNFCYWTLMENSPYFSKSFFWLGARCLDLKNNSINWVEDNGLNEMIIIMCF